MGLASPMDLRTAEKHLPRSFWGYIKGILDNPESPLVVAVCLPPGAQLILKNVPEELQRRWTIEELEDVFFVQISANVNTYRDAIRFRNGREVLLQNLREGIRMQVLSLDNVYADNDKDLAIPCALAIRVVCILVSQRRETELRSVIGPMLVSRGPRTGTMRPLVWHLTASIGSVVAIIVVCARVPHVDHATVALLLVMVIVSLASAWGLTEALTATLVGGIGFEYYFLPARGLIIANLEQWFALGAFLITAVVTSQIAATLRQRRIEAVEQESEKDKLYKLMNVLLNTGGHESALQRLANELLAILGAEGVVLYDKHSGQFFRSGQHTGAVSDFALRETATSGLQIADEAVSLAPVRHSGELVGSLGICGATFSEALLSALAGCVGLGLARRYAIEKTTEAEAVRRAEELKSAVLDAMAHEIRNPLNSVKIAATTLLSGHAGSEVHKHEMLTIIDEEVNRMDRFIDEAVQLARVEANELSLKREPQNLALLITAAIAEMGALAGDRRIHLSLPESLPPAECDRDMIARVLKQLLGNALKYSPDDSPLKVSAEFTGAAVVIDVVDHGPGVKDEERDRIFEKYYRGRAAKSRTPGTGLGLASARSIVEAHGGKIWVTSPPDGGAAFHVSLPVNGNGDSHSVWA